MKGQMFIVAAVFMIVGMVLIKNMLDFDVISEQKKFIESQSSGMLLENILSEYKYTTGIALAQPVKNESGIIYLSNLSSFLRKDLKTFSSLYAFAYVNTTTGKMSVTVGNYLSGNISVMLNATDSSPIGYVFSLSDSDSTTKEFAYTAGIKEINITLNYTIQSMSDLEIFKAVAKNSTSAYFDLRINEKNIQLRVKETYNRTLQVIEWTT